jgi:serine/threonine-protein phosphatase 6 regulatory ankyrin repeat subunit C
MLSSAGANVDQTDAEGNTALHLAGIDTDGDRVSASLEAGASINATNHQGRTPLHVFAQKIYTWDLDDGMDAPFQRLLKAHPNVNAQDKEGFTPLHVLAQADTSFKVEATKALLEAGADPNLRDHHGRTPVHLFLTGKWPWSEAGECLQLLLDAGADFSARDDQQRTPLHYLAALGERDEKPLFFLNNADKVFIAAKVDFEARDADNNTPLHLAAKSGVMDVYEWLVKQGANADVTNAAGETPRLLALHSNAHSLRFRTDPETDIFVAARAGKLDAIASLLKAEPRLLNETNFAGQTPLALAALGHRTNVLEFLAAKGAHWDPTSALIAGRVETLRTLLSKQSTNVAQLNNWLHLAAAQGSVENARILIDRGANVNAPDARGMSPLGWARRCQNVAMEKFLREHGARENIFDAAYGNDSEIATALLKSDKNLAFATNSFGISATQVAAFAGADDILSSFLKQKVPLNLADAHYRQTLLHLATINDHSSTVELLIRRGAEINAYDRFGFTPLHLAAYLDSTESMKVLLRHHANPELSVNMPKDGVRGISGVPYAGVTGDTALHLAAQSGATNAILLLTQSGLSINSTNRFGGTPLDAASAFPHMGGMFEPRILERILTPLNAAAIATNKSISYLPRRQGTIAFIEQLGGKHGQPRSVPTGITPFPGRPWH